MNQEQYPGLNGLSWGIGYLEQLLAILSEPLLIACAALAVIDFVTGGKLLTLPAIMYVWAGSLAIAVSACFIVTWRRAIYAVSRNHYGSAIGLVVLGLALGVVDWSAVDVQSLQQTMGVSFAAALSQLNLNIILITHLRSAVAIAMAVVVAVSNHTQVSTATAPKRRLVFVDKVLNRIAPMVEVEAVQENGEGLRLLESGTANDKQVYQAPIGFPSKRDAVLEAADRHPSASVEEIARIADCSVKTAAKWLAERTGA